MGVSKTYRNQLLQAVTGRTQYGPANNNAYIGLSIVDPYYYGEKASLTGTTTPSTSTVAAFEGEMYCDTTRNLWYICSAITGSVYTWIAYNAVPTQDTLIYLEPSDSAYERAFIGNYQTGTSQKMMDPDTTYPNATRNKETIFFPEAEANWGIISSFILCGSSSGGTPTLWGTLTSSVTVNTGYVAIFKTDQLRISVV